MRHLIFLAFILAACNVGSVAANPGLNLATRSIQPNTGDRAPEVSPAAPKTSVAPAPQQFDYSANANSDVFGAQLFTGSFARAGSTQFNPDYLIASGDRVQVRLWGGFTF